MLAHMVFFTLKDDSPAAVERLVAGCRHELAGHEGEVFFAAGSRAVEFARAVNDDQFHVALCVVFTDKAAHDAYQAHPRHARFIAEHSGNWRQVRVFDAYVGGA